MSISDEIINRFNAVFGEPRTPDPDTFLTEFARCMDGYDENALRKAADRLIATSTFWPKPAELLAEANRILADKRKFQPPENETFRIAPKTPEQLAMANELVANFKKFMAENVTISEKPDTTTNWKRGQRPGFEAMQRNSPNPGLHITPKGLSDISRRITGERDE